jgi:hypothetical protein
MPACSGTILFSTPFSTDMRTFSIAQHSIFNCVYGTC